MTKQIEAAESSNRREDNAPTVPPNPDSESRPLGVAADGDRDLGAAYRIAEAVEKLTAELRCMVEKHSNSQSRDLPRKAYTIKEVAEMCGVKVGAIEYQIKICNLIPVVLGKDRRRVILEEDLDNCLKAHRRPLKDEKASSKKRT